MVNLFKFTLLAAVIILSTTRCNTNITPNIIEDYIISNCNFDDLNESHINLKKVLNIDYDTLFVIYSLENTTGIRNISGYKKFEKNFINFGWNEDVYIFVLKKDGRVVYYDLCNLYSRKIHIDLYSFKEIYCKGYFDNEEVYSTGRFTTDSIFLVRRKGCGSNSYNLLCRNTDSIKKRYIKRDVIPIYLKPGETPDMENWVIIE